MQGKNESAIASAIANVKAFNISVVGHQSLRTVCLHVDQETLPQLIADLKEVCFLLKGAGFAANQLGSNSRVCVVNPPNGELYVMVEPTILERSEEKVTAREGCFSIPGYTALVERHKSVMVMWLDEHGSEHKGWAEGDEARYVQHEIAHLDGKLISDGNVFGGNKLKAITRDYRKRGYVIRLSELGEII